MEWVIGRFPDHGKAIRDLSKKENFVELCEHFAWMAEAAEVNPDLSKRTRYAELRDQLEAELRNYLKIPSKP